MYLIANFGNIVPRRDLSQNKINNLIWQRLKRKEANKRFQIEIAETALLGDLKDVLNTKPQQSVKGKRLTLEDFGFKPLEPYTPPRIITPKLVGGVALGLGLGTTGALLTRHYYINQRKKKRER